MTRRSLQGSNQTLPRSPPLQSNTKSLDNASCSLLFPFDIAINQSSSDTHYMVVKVINSLEEFNDIIREPSSVVIEFCAGWCGPSQKINPTFDKCSEHYGLSFYRVDIDCQPTIVQAANVQKIPLFAVFRQGKRLGSVEGADNRALATLLESHS